MNKLTKEEAQERLVRQREEDQKNQEKYGDLFGYVTGCPWCGNWGPATGCVPCLEMMTKEN